MTRAEKRLAQTVKYLAQMQGKMDDCVARKLAIQSALRPTSGVALEFAKVADETVAVSDLHRASTLQGTLAKGLKAAVGYHAEAVRALAEAQATAAHALTPVEIVSAAVGVPMSDFLEETEGGDSVLWLWPSDVVGDDAQAAVAVGIKTQTFTLCDGDRRYIGAADSMDEALQVVVARLAAPVVAAGKQKKVKAAYVPSGLTFGPVEVSDADRAAVEAAAEQTVVKRTEIRWSGHADSDSTTVTWLSTADDTVGITMTRWGLHVLSGGQSVLAKPDSLAGALMAAGRRLSPRPVLDAEATLEERIIATMRWLDRSVSTSEMSGLLGLEWPVVFHAMSEMRAQLRAADVDLGWAQGGFYRLAESDAPEPDGGERIADDLDAETAAVVAFNAAGAALDARMASLIGMATDSVLPPMCRVLRARRRRRIALKRGRHSTTRLVLWQVRRLRQSPSARHPLRLPTSAVCR